jgi:hypothetical protein
MRHAILFGIATLSLTGVMDPSGFWQGLATVLGSAAVWAQRRANPEQNPVDELCFRLRHPIKHACRHPIVTLKRKRDRRQS